MEGAEERVEGEEAEVQGALTEEEKGDNPAVEEEKEKTNGKEEEEEEEEEEGKGEGDLHAGEDVKEVEAEREDEGGLSDREGDGEGEEEVTREMDVANKEAEVETQEDAGRGSDLDDAKEEEEEQEDCGNNGSEDGGEEEEMPGDAMNDETENVGKEELQQTVDDKEALDVDVVSDAEVESRNTAAGHDEEDEEDEEDDDFDIEQDRVDERQEDAAKGDELEVELCVLPEKYIHRQRWVPSTRASTVLDDVSSLLGLPRESLSLFTLEPRTSISSSTLLSSLPQPTKGSKLHLELGVDTVKPLHLLRRGGDEDALLTGRLRVEVDMGSESRPKQVVVLVEREPGKKAFLGGFRSKRNGTVFHNAESQTLEGLARGGRAQKPSTATQTCVMTPAGVQTGREQGTQMPRGDLLIDVSRDVHMEPRPYVSSEEHLQRKLNSVIVIQCHARGYLARKLARRLRREKEEEAIAADAEKQLRAYELEKTRRYEIERRMHPSTKEDFAILRRELRAWKEQELNEIRARATDAADAHKQMLALLNKETKLLQTIDRLKNHAASDTRDVRTAAMLGEMSAAKGWSLRDGDTIDVHTPTTVRARELMQLYNALRLPLLTLDERLDVLLHVKWTVKEFDCSLTREIVSLVDREADLLNRGRDVQRLANLRKRTANLFLKFIETPEFNPESERFRLVA